MDEKNNVYFVPVRGSEQAVLKHEFREGNVYFTNDTGKIYIDIDEKNPKKLFGNAGVTVFYGTATATEVEGGNQEYTIPYEKEAVSDYKNCKAEDLILNTDGCFYKIISIDEAKKEINCIRLSVSGNGGGGNGQSYAQAASAEISKKVNMTQYVNGQPVIIYVTPHAALNMLGTPMDTDLTINLTLSSVDADGEKSLYDSWSIPGTDGVQKEIDLSGRIRENMTSDLTIQVEGIGSGPSRTYSSGLRFIMCALTLTPYYDFSALKIRQDTAPNFPIQYVIGGSTELDKIATLYIDGKEADNLKTSSIGEKSFIVSMDKLTHGAHTFEIELAQYDKDSNSKPVILPKLSYQIAIVKAGAKEPIIWFGEYKKTYYSYDKIQIPFMVYDPENPTSAFVSITSTNDTTQSTDLIINYNDYSTNNEWCHHEIIDSKIGDYNNYYFSCGKTQEVISFSVEKDETRQMELLPTGLLINFSAAGKSNAQSAVLREQWSYVDENNVKQNATFNDFNWYNNGWILDKSKNTCLRISNGASFQIPFNQLEINRTDDLNKASCTFEFEFKVHNIQQYSNLVKEITRYHYRFSEQDSWTEDTEFWEAFEKQQTFDSYDEFIEDYFRKKDQLSSYYNLTQHHTIVHTNYDAFLKDFLSDTNRDDIYDILVLSKVNREFNPESAFFNYYDGTAGLCLGPQDGFFTNGTNTVNIKFVEDDLINLTVVFDKSGDESKRASLLLMYVNGVLTSVAKSTATGGVTIAPKDNQGKYRGIVFSSNSCDVDLYKFRMYRTGLDVKQVCLNYSVDKRNTLIYDETTLLSPQANSTSGEYYIDFDALEKFNRDLPDFYTMPYMIISTNPDGQNINNLLPYSKAITIPVNIEFVNPGLERAYKTGMLNQVAEKMTQTQKDAAKAAKLSNVEYYYLHHCPSFVTELSELSVQGTSSEFYPRRNYKLKTQKKVYKPVTDADGHISEYKDEKTYTMTFNRGPFATNPQVAQKTWYMDNDYVGTNKWTLKIDYMESSGSYNCGLGNLVDGAYAKHPLEYYLGLGNINTDYVNSLRTNVAGFPMMMFHKKLNQEGEQDGQIKYIGRYNMLLDKGSDDCYGFSPLKKSSKFDPSFSAYDAKKGEEAVQPFVLDEKGNPMKVKDVVEVWEYSDNARTYCSFRDPLGRPEFSFRKGTAEDFSDEELNSVKSCPLVADSYEYRYNCDDDMLDYIYNPADYKAKKGEDDIKRLQFEYKDIIGDINSIADRSRWLFNKMKNWEKACAWVWSTCTDNVPSLGTYQIVDVAEKKFDLTKDKYYMVDSVDSEGKYSYKEVTEDFNKDYVYYVLENNEYKVIKLTDDESKIYKQYKYYIKQGNNYLLSTDLKYDMTKVYYELIEDMNSTAETLAEPYTVGSVTYTKDTKEYRLAKFKQEFEKHFNKDYTLIYFMVTEVLMLYDSRGKNCMMASWGPQERDGDYIWFPIFYDMDTQLGINNTGIPSFDYYVNAHQDGCFSTNDSVLWANVYACFFDDLKAVYTQLRKLGGIFNDVLRIDATYRSDPSVNPSYAAKGERPLMAINLDEWYKYITITLPANIAGGYQGKTEQTQAMSDSDCTYFYALQGDRSQSRIQFLQKRLNFTDGWLNYGSYSRSGGNAIYGRCSANDGENTSDRWLDMDGSIGNYGQYLTKSPYYTGAFDFDGNPIKTNYLDADTFVELKPYQRSYVTIGGDNEALPSVECKDNSIRYTVPMANSLRLSPNYAEQLLYIYGAEYLQSIGDSSLMYWREFYAPNAPKLRTLLLGSDYPGFKNNVLKYPTVAASKTSTNGGKPLLEEVNFTNVKFRQDEGTSADFNFNFDSSEKLKIFKACGSNIAQVIFADGVALHTLYLPNTIKTLELVEANNLTNIITDASIVAPTLENFNTWKAPKGLYIEGLTDNVDTSTLINTVHIDGGKLGYDSYRLLNRLYELKKDAPTGLKLQMKKVDWSPYDQIVEGYEPKAGETYYLADDHFRLLEYTGSTLSTSAEWKANVANGLLYKLKENSAELMDIIDENIITTLVSMAENNGKFTDLNSNPVPEITGTIYINSKNATIVEDNFNETVQKKYPNVKFFINKEKISTGLTAKFVKVNNDGVNVQIGIQQKLPAGTTEWQFENPYALYPWDTTDELKKTNYDFVGWALNGPNEPVVINVYNNPEFPGVPSDNEIHQAWFSQSLTDQTDYIFYAVYTKHKYTISFYDQGQTEPFFVEYKAIDEQIEQPTITPYKDDSGLDKDERYGLHYTWNLLGYNRSTTDTVAVPLNTIAITGDLKLYTVWDSTPVSVYENIHPEYFAATPASWADTYDPKYSVSINEGVCLSLITDVTGKLTVPAYFDYNGKRCKVIAIDSTFGGTYRVLEGTGLNGHGDKLTHVFFEKTNEYDEAAKSYVANIRYIGRGAFYGEAGNLSPLKYCEFPVGLRQINAYAFANGFNRKNKPNFENTNIGGTITTIQAQAFNGCFSDDITTLTIGPSVTVIQKMGIQISNASSSLTQLDIGDNLTKSNLNLSSSAPDCIVISKTVDMNFYTSKYTSSDQAIVDKAINSNGLSIVQFR